MLKSHSEQRKKKSGDMVERELPIKFTDDGRTDDGRRTPASCAVAQSRARIYVLVKLHKFADDGFKFR